MCFAGKCECGKCTCYPPGDSRVYGKACECDDRRCEDLDGVVCGGEQFSHLSACNLRYLIFLFYLPFKKILLRRRYTNSHIQLAYGSGGGGLVAKSRPTLATPSAVAHQAPLSMGFSRREYWSGLPFPSPQLAYPYMHIRIQLDLYN